VTGVERDEREAHRFIEAHWGDYVDPRTNEVDYTQLAEAAAHHVGRHDWLDDHTHPVFDWAMEVPGEHGYNGRMRPNSSPADWEAAHAVIEKGLEHPAFKAIDRAWQEVEKSIAEARERSRGMKRIGVGRTEDPTLVASGIVPALQEFADEVKTIADQLKRRVGE
jgi:hypothetical protein